MEDRIQINGVWYVREQDDAIQESIEIDPIHFIGCVYENYDYCWEATRMYDSTEADTFYPDIDIKFTDKRIKPWKEEEWDSSSWMLGVLENHPENMHDARELMCEEGIKQFQSFLQYLKEKGWFTQKNK